MEGSSVLEPSNYPSSKGSPMHSSTLGQECQKFLPGKKLSKNVKDLIWIRWGPKNEASKEDRAQKPAATVHLDGFNRWPPLLWFWPPETRLEDPKPPLPLAHMMPIQPSLRTQCGSAHKRRERLPSLQWVSTLMLTLHLPELEPAWLVTPGPLWPNRNSCRRAS